LPFAEIIMGGNGAGPANDGAEVVAQMLSNTGNTPSESIEMVQSFVRIGEYAMIPDSGGARRQRGGLGVRRSYEILKDNVLISTNSDRHDSSPWGLAGGHDSGRTKFTLYRDNQATRVPGASNIECRKGDRFVIEICGGGYGNPTKRDQDAIRDDLRCGRVTKDAAKELYGFREAAAE
jgi:N-methylhydantoinase B